MISGDEERRTRERKALLGDEGEALRVENSRARKGEGLLGYLNNLLEKPVYVEGVRINYRGTPREIFVHPDGRITGIVFFPLQRVSWFEQNGPRAGYTFTHKKPCFVAWDGILEIGEDGFAEGVWAPVQEPAS